MFVTYAVLPCSDPWRRLIRADLKYAAASLSPAPDTPTGDKGGGKNGVREINRHRLAERPHATRTA